MLTTDVLFYVRRQSLRCYIFAMGAKMLAVWTRMYNVHFCAHLYLVKLSVQDKMYLSCPEKLLSFSLFHKRGADMIIFKFHKFPMYQISEETLFFNFTHSAMNYIHTQSGFLLFSYIYSPTDVYLARRALAVVDRINS